MRTPRPPSPPSGGEDKSEGGSRIDRARNLRKNQTDAERMRFWDREVWNNLEGILKTIWKALPDK